MKSSIKWCHLKRDHISLTTSSSLYLPCSSCIYNLSLHLWTLEDTFLPTSCLMYFWTCKYYSLPPPPKIFSSLWLNSSPSSKTEYPLVLDCVTWQVRMLYSQSLLDFVNVTHNLTSAKLKSLCLFSLFLLKQYSSCPIILAALPLYLVLLQYWLILKSIKKQLTSISSVACWPTTLQISPKLAAHTLQTKCKKVATKTVVLNTANKNQSKKINGF